MRYADGVRVVKSEAAGPRLAEAGGYHISKNNELEFTLEQDLEPWLKFPRFVDGVRTVDEFLLLADLTESDVWIHLEEAIEYEVPTAKCNQQ